MTDDLLDWLLKLLVMIITVCTVVIFSTLNRWFLNRIKKGISWAISEKAKASATKTRGKSA
jgi:uncharacterized membrane protein